MASITVNLKGFDEIQKKLARASSRAEHLLAVQVQKDTEPYVPALTLSLTNRTQVIGNTIVYPGPYARYLYNGKVMIDPEGGIKTVNENGVEVVRFRKGAKLVETDRDLKIQQTVHPYAQAHWFEASKANNKDKWIRVGGRMVKYEF